MHVGNIVNFVIVHFMQVLFLSYYHQYCKSAMWPLLHWIAVVKKELSWNPKILIYQSIFVPPFKYGHELWGVTRGMRSCTEAAKMIFLVWWLCLVLKIVGDIQRELAVKRSQLRWYKPLIKMPPEHIICRFLSSSKGDSHWGRPRGITYLIWP